GLGTEPPPPRSSPRARSRAWARGVRKTIGIALVRSPSISSSATCQPSSPGIITSSRITSGSSLRAISSPVGPSLASSTSIPSASRFTRQRRRIGGSSSITNTRVMRPRFRPAYTRSQADSLALTQDRRRRKRQREHEARALALDRAHRDAALHGGQQLLGHEEPEAGATAREVATAALGSVELREDPRLLRLRNPNPLVLHAHLHRVVSAAGGDSDGAAAGRVLDGVLDEIHHDLPQLLAVGGRGQRLRREVELELMAVEHERLLGGRDHLGDDLADVGRSELYLKVAGVELGDGE